MPTREVVEYLVVSDRAAQDVTDLYPLDGPVNGQSTVSVPLFLAPPDGVAGAKINLSSDSSALSSADHTILWSGVLAAPTGDIVISDWSMQPQATVQLRPGPFSLTITQGGSGALGLDFFDWPEDDPGLR